MQIVFNKTVHYPDNIIVNQGTTIEGEILSIDDKSLYVKVHSDLLFRIMFQDIESTEMSVQELEQWRDNLPGING